MGISTIFFFFFTGNIKNLNNFFVTKLFKLICFLKNNFFLESEGRYYNSDDFTVCTVDLVMFPDRLSMDF